MAASEVASFETNFFRIADSSEAETSMSGKAECLLATGEDKKSNMTVSFNKTELCHSMYTKNVYVTGHSPLRLFRTNANKQ